MSKDLDPLYVAATDCWTSTDPQLYRWLIAYWCFYHAGFACYASEFEGDDFWQALLIAGRNEVEAPIGGRWPRGHERRHFRAKIAEDSLSSLRETYGSHPEYMISVVTHGFSDRLRFREVAEAAKNHRGFGPWMAFKVADMVDRVLGIPVDFDQAAVFMFDDPVKAAYMLYEQRNPLPEGVANRELKRNSVINAVVDYLTRYFSAHQAPPFNDRPVGLQEVETILCKWKSHMNGHYPLNNDIDEITLGLSQWSSACDTARKMHLWMPDRLEVVHGV